MRLLFIGGTGLISSACTDLALALGHELHLLNRGLAPKYPPPRGARLIKADIHDPQDNISVLLDGLRFDAVVDFVAFSAAHIERDLKLFGDRTDQFVFISSASAYQKPPANYRITETTPLDNPFWAYSRGKIEAEDRLMQACKADGFPATIVRPSLTYGPAQIPLCVGSWEHPWTVIARMLSGRQVIVPGDGTSLWVVTWNGDFARGLLGLLGKPDAIGEAFHITSDEVLTWDQIYLEVFDALGLRPKIVHAATDLIARYWPHAEGSLKGDKIYSVVFDNNKIKRLVPDFACEVDWAHGVRRAIEWHRAHPQFQTVDMDLERILDEIIEANERALSHT